MGWRKRPYYFDQWPGRGPFNYLPPWQRPGRVFGRRGYGRWYSGDQTVCARYPWLPRWWWADPKYAYQPSAFVPTSHDQIAALEESKTALGEEKASIEAQIVDVEAQLKELKAKLEADKKQPTE